jgi:kanamycin nucleotidyltransferase
MKGLQKYTHQDRQRIIEKILPQIREKFGNNLIALAAQGSFARGEDSDYSDLELIAFVKKMPEGRHGIGKIREGLLIELVWMTREDYIAETLEVTEDWHISASDKLLPIINAEFISELSKYRAENLKEKCLAEAARHWNEVQESTSKVLNAIKAENRDGLPLVLFDMMRHFLVSLSLLNQTPYTTFARFVSEARVFAIKPAEFAYLLDLIVLGAYQDLPKLEKLIISVFSQFERIFDEFGIELYDEKIDLN